MSNFKIILTALFVFFILIAVLMFAGVIPGSNNAPTGVGGEVIIWGTISESQLRTFFDTINQNNKLYKISYVEKNKKSFNSELVEALASGQGPDIFFLPQDLILSYSNKVATIAYSAIPERQFRDTYVEEGELFLNNEGISALPVLIDPMVMYWNRDILSSSGVAKTPTTWSEFLEIVPTITILDKASNIIQNTIAFGEFNNISNAKDILSILTIQAGNPIVIKSEIGWQAVLDETFGFANKPTEAALRFYTEFSNPSKITYSWNRAEPLSRDAFISGKLAIYFGYTSEFNDIKNRNPHLNFDVALLPQAKETKKKSTFGRIEGLAIARSSQNIPTAFEAVKLLSSQNVIKEFSNIMSLPPVRRDLLKNKPTDAYGSIFYDSALMSKGWLDPSPQKTNNIFRDMIEGVSSGKFRISESVSRANAELNQLLK